MALPWAVTNSLCAKEIKDSFSTHLSDFSLPLILPNKKGKKNVVNKYQFQSKGTKAL